MNWKVSLLYLYICLIDRHSFSVPQNIVLLIPTIHRLHAYMHTTNLYVRIDISNSMNKKRNKTGTGNKFLPVSAHAVCKHMIRTCFIKYYSDYYSLTKQSHFPRESRANAKSFLSVYISQFAEVSKENAREQWAEQIHWKIYRCDCLCYDVITWFTVITMPCIRHGQHVWRVCKQNGNNRLAAIRHYLLRTHTDP